MLTRCGARDGAVLVAILGSDIRSRERSNYISMHKVRNRSGFRGFTLIELMITLVVAGILLGLAVPSFRDFVQRNRLITDVNRWVGDLNYARSEALKRNQLVSICRFGANQTCDGTANCNCGNGTSSRQYDAGYIIFVDQDDDATFEPGIGEVLLRKVGAGSSGVAASGSDQANLRLSFLANGALDPGDWPANTIFCMNGESTNSINGRRVAINQLGRTTLVSLANGAACGGGGYNTADTYN